jgi:hypothetical protein
MTRELLKVHRQEEKQGLQLKDHGISGGWRRSYKYPNNVRLVGSILSIIAEFHASLVVDDLLNEWSIYHIHGPMVECKYQF